MKKPQQLFASVVLTLVLSISTFAGDGTIWTMKTDPPPPPPSVATKNAVEAEGIMATGRAVTDPVMEIVLGLLPSVLALF